MGTWGIARDMAKRNEENLAQLSARRDVYKKLVQAGGSSVNIYRYKKATPEQLREIREQRKAEQARLRRKSLLIGAFCALLFVTLLVLAFTL